MITRMLRPVFVVSPCRGCRFTPAEMRAVFDSRIVKQERPKMSSEKK